LEQNEPESQKDKEIDDDLYLPPNRQPSQSTRAESSWPMYLRSPLHNGFTTDLGPTTDEVQWFSSTGGETYGSPAVVNGRVYIGGGDGMNCYYANNGTLAWRTPTIWAVAGGYGVSSSPAVDNGCVYFGGDRIYCLYESDGSIKWTVTDPGNQNYGDGLPTIANGKVFIGGSDKRLYCIDKENGTVLWRTQAFTGGVYNYGLFGAPTVHDGHVYLAACNGYIYKINETGQPAPPADALINHSYNTGRPMYGSPVYVDGKIYVGNGYYNSDHPNNLFPFSRAAFEARREADVVAAFGTCLGELDLPWDKYWGGPSQKLVQVDIDPRNLGAHRPLHRGIVADAGTALRALVKRLREMGVRPADGARVAAYKAKVEQWRAEALQPFVDACTDEKIHPVQSVLAAGEVFPQGSVNFADGGNTSLFNLFFSRFTKPRSSLGLAEFGHDYQQLPLGIVAISSNDVSTHPEDGPDRMRQEATEAGYTFPYLYDESQDVARDYQAACTPDFYLFDGQMKLVYRGQMDGSRPNSGQPVTGQDLRQALDDVLAGRPVDPEQKPSLGCNIKWRE